MFLIKYRVIEMCILHELSGASIDKAHAFDIHELSTVTDMALIGMTCVKATNCDPQDPMHMVLSP